MVNSQLIEVTEDFSTISMGAGQTVIVDFQLLLPGAEELLESSAISRDNIIHCEICNPRQLRITAHSSGTATIISTVGLLPSNEIVDRLGLVVQVSQAS